MRKRKKNVKVKMNDSDNNDSSDNDNLNLKYHLQSVDDWLPEGYQTNDLWTTQN